MSGEGQDASRKKLHEMVRTFTDLEYKLQYMTEKIAMKPCSQTDEEEVEWIQHDIRMLQLQIDDFLHDLQGVAEAGA